MGYVFHVLWACNPPLPLRLLGCGKRLSLLFFTIELSLDTVLIWCSVEECYIGSHLLNVQFGFIWYLKIQALPKNKNVIN